MATLAQSEAHRTTISRIATVADREVVATARAGLRTQNAARATTSLIETLMPVAETYRDVTATVGADFYADLRGSRLPAYRPVLTSQDVTGRVEALARWGTTPVWSDDPDVERAVQRIRGGMQRIVTDADRETIVENIRRDPARARWARHASANACAFCAMLATRGADYRTEATASQAHDHCRCVAVPVWDDFEEAPYVPRWREAYDQAAAGGKTTEEILADMRERLGTN